MKNIALLAFALALPLVQASSNVIYGEDNRKDVYQVTNALHLSLADSTAGMIHLGHFARSKEKGKFNIHSVPTLERGQNICSTENFSQQLTAPSCSGFLVGPDTIVTAGHCYKSFDTPEDVCKRFAWVFDFNMKSESHDPTKDIPITNIYFCQSVVAAKMNKDLDYAVIKLDRKVKGRKPLDLRASGKVSDSSSLIVIGHPSGLPTKISDGGKVTENSGPISFSTTLDTFVGNSGSPVFDSKTGLVEGILIQGKQDYLPSIADKLTSCKVANKCDDNGVNCVVSSKTGPMAHGEVVLRISEALKDIETALKM